MSEQINTHSPEPKARAKAIPRQAKKAKAPPPVAEPVVDEESHELSTLTPNDFLKGLAQRVTGDNARLLLNTALVRTGLHVGQTNALMLKHDAKTLCLELIRTGGPAFHVGQALYREVH